MTENQNKDEILKLPSAIIKEYKDTVKYLSEEYFITIQRIESSEDKELIELFAEKKNSSEFNFYSKKIKYEEFKNLGKIFIFFDSIEEIYNFITSKFKEKKISIKEIIYENYLILTIKSEITELGKSLITDIKLSRKELDKNEIYNLYKIIKDQDDLIKELHKKIETLEEKINIKPNANVLVYKSIRVLQIYPHPDVSNQLKKWMEIDGYGKGIIYVDSVYIDVFNNDPSGWLKLGDNWNYDVIFFGASDANAGKNISLKAVNVTKEFIKSGRGCIMGHDTIGYKWGNDGFNMLREYFGLKIGKWDKSSHGDYPNQWGYTSSKINITKKELVTSYPWNLDRETINIKRTHTSSNSAFNENIYFELCEGNYDCGQELNELRKEGYFGTYYLSIKENCAMIQAGHSGEVTSDEKKIISNLIFYLYQKKNNIGNNNV